MAPLSRELAGLILSHDHYGSHLDSQGKTIDEELEKQNFEFAGKTLAELWSQVVIDGAPTISEYIDPEFGELRSERLLSKDLDWMAKHVRTSQYLTQIVKCADIDCCGKRRSPYFSFVSSRFLPPPFPLQQTIDGGIITPKQILGDGNKFPSLFLALSSNVAHLLPEAKKEFKRIPYDLFCPSVQSCLVSRICKICGLYFASQKMMKAHSSHHRKSSYVSLSLSSEPSKIRPVRIAARRQRELMAVIVREEGEEDVEWFEEEELDLSNISLPTKMAEKNSGLLPVFDIEEYLSIPWEDEKV